MLTQQSARRPGRSPHTADSCHNPLTDQATILLNHKLWLWQPRTAIKREAGGGDAQSGVCMALQRSMHAWSNLQRSLWFCSQFQFGCLTVCFKHCARRRKNVMADVCMVGNNSVHDGTWKHTSGTCAMARSRLWRGPWPRFDVRWCDGGRGSFAYLEHSRPEGQWHSRSHGCQHNGTLTRVVLRLALASCTHEPRTRINKPPGVGPRRARGDEAALHEAALHRCTGAGSKVRIMHARKSMAPHSAACMLGNHCLAWPAHARHVSVSRSILRSAAAR
jgi:hypothetical protein